MIVRTDTVGLFRSLGTTVHYGGNTRRAGFGRFWPVSAIYWVGETLPVRSSLSNYTSPIRRDKFLLLTES
jgi:hypothetical protein